MTENVDVGEDLAPSEGGGPHAIRGQRAKGMTAKRHAVHLFGKRMALPRSRGLRICIGGLLVFGGLLGFLPVLGFWMIPLGLLVLSHDLASVRRWRRRFVVWWERRRKARRERR